MSAHHDDPQAFPGRPADTGLILSFLDACIDHDQPGQAEHAAAISADAWTTARLAEMAAVATQEQLGGLPDSLTDGGTPLAVLLGAGLDGQRAVMWDRAAEMPATDRRAAVEQAGDLLTGLTMM